MGMVTIQKILIYKNKQKAGGENINNEQLNVLIDFVLRQGLTMLPKLALNSQSSCLSLQSAGITHLF
jgi:hypothetical protein